MNKLTKLFIYLGIFLSLTGCAHTMKVKTPLTMMEFKAWIEKASDIDLYKTVSLEKYLNVRDKITYGINSEERDILKNELKVRKPNWTEYDIDKIMQHKIWIGMTDEQLLASRGKTSDINRSVGKWGVHEQWVYGIYGRTCIYLENDKVTGWHDKGNIKTY